MALFLLATPVSGNSISSTAYINEFNNIYQNAVALISPLTAAVNANSKEITNFSLETLSATPSTQKAGRLVFLTVGKQFVLDDGAQMRFVPAHTALSTGDIPIATSSNQIGKLSIGTTGQFLTVSGGLPAWGSTIGPTSILTPAIVVTTLNATALFASSITTTTLAATSVAATTVQAHGSLTVGGGSAIEKIVSATGSCVWPAMNAAATIATTITISGATGTDQVMVSHSAVTTASVLMYGYVSATNTVTVSLYNGTGATYNPGSGTLRATLFKYV